MDEGRFQPNTIILAKHGMAQTAYDGSVRGGGYKVPTVQSWNLLCKWDTVHGIFEFLTWQGSLKLNPVAVLWLRLLSCGLGSSTADELLW